MRQEKRHRTGAQRRQPAPRSLHCPQGEHSEANRTGTQDPRRLRCREEIGEVRAILPRGAGLSVEKIANTPCPHLHHCEFAATSKSGQQKSPLPLPSPKAGIALQRSVGTQWKRALRVIHVSAGIYFCDPCLPFAAEGLASRQGAALAFSTGPPTAIPARLSGTELPTDPPPCPSTPPWFTHPVSPSHRPHRHFDRPVGIAGAEPDSPCLMVPGQKSCTNDSPI